LIPFGRPWLWTCALLGIGACAVAPTAPAASLAGSRWVGVADSIADSRSLPRLEFGDGGRVMGYTGCNTLSGTWSEQGGEVRLGAIAATKRMCLGPGAEVEKRVLAVLGDASRVTREGSRLVITAPGGERFEFVPA
jgi:heat shock protein HslJ